MNRTHRLVFNRRTGVCQAVSETARSAAGGPSGARCVVALAAALIVGTMSPVAAAATWTAVAPGDWLDGSNWQEGAPPTIGEHVFFWGSGTAEISGSGAVAYGDHMSLGSSVSGMVKVTDGGTLNIFRLAVGVDHAGTIEVNGRGSLLKVDGGILFGLGATGVGILSIANGGTVRVGGGRELELGNVPGGSGTLNLNAGGTLEVGAGQGLRPAVAGATGTFNWAGGTLRVTTGDLTTGMPATLTGTTSTLDTNGFGATLSGVLSGDGALTKTGGGMLRLFGDNTYSGGTTLSAGTLIVGNAAALGTGALNAAGGTTLDASAAVTLGNDVDLGGNLTVGGSQALRLDGKIAGAGGLFKNGAASLSLNGVNSYKGGTVLNGGTLIVGSDTALGTGALITGAGTTLDASVAVTLGNDVNLAGNLTLGGSHALTLNGTVTGAGGLTKNGASNLVLNGDNEFLGGTTLNAGTLTVGNSGALGLGGLTVAGAATLDSHTAVLLGNHMALNADLSIGGTQDLAFSGTISGNGGLIKNGAANLTLYGANSYSGGTTLSAGTLTVGNAAALGASALTVTGDSVLSNHSPLRLHNAVDLDHANLTLGGNHALTLDGVIGGTGGLVKVGVSNLVINGANDFLGGTILNAGTLTVGHDTALGVDPLTVAGAATLDSNTAVALDNRFDLKADLTVGGTRDLTFSGPVTGAGGLIKNGAANLTLNGVHTYSGDTTVNGGRLTVNGSVAESVQVNSSGTLGGSGTIERNVTVASGAHLAPGNSIGTLTIAGDLSLAQGSVLDFEFGAPGSSYAVPGVGDSVKVGVDLYLNGATLNIIDTGTMGPGIYNLFSYGNTLTRTNGGIALGGAAPNNFSVQYLTGDKKVNLVNIDPAQVLNFWNGNGLASATQMGGGDGTWSATQPNWTDVKGAVTAAMQPQPGFAIFGGAAGHVVVDNTDGAVAATGIQFASDGYRLSGGTLTLVADKASPGPVELRVGDGSAAGSSWNATIGNVIAGTDGVVKTGNGTLALTGLNTYSGGTAVRGGALQISDDRNLGAVGAGLTLDAGTLRIASGSAPIISARAVMLGAGGGTLDLGANLLGFVSGIGGTGALSVTGAGGTLAIAAPNTYEGGTTLMGGASVSVAGAGTLGAGAVQQQGSGTRLVFTAGAKAGSNSYTVGRSGMADVGNRMSFAQDASAMSSTLFVNGAGWQTPDANALQFGDASTAATSSITNQGGAVYFLRDATAGNATIVNGGKSLLSFLGASSAGTAQIANHSGGTVHFEGTATGAHARIANAAGGTVDVSGSTSASGVEIGSLSGAGALVLGASKLTLGALNTNDTLSGVVSDKGSQFAQPGAGTGGSVVKVGSGTLTLSGANTYTGGTALRQGRLNVGHSRALGTGALTMDDDTTLGFSAEGVSLANAIRLTGQNDPVIDTGAFSATLAGAISGGGFITKQGTGTLTLSGANTYTGATNVAQGTLKAGALNTFSASSAHSVATGATLDLAGFDQTVASLANSGTVSLVGAAAGTTLTVNGNYVGNNGVLKLAAALNGTGLSDRLVINGGAASGKTSVQVANLGGLGALTTGDGIEVIGARNGATTTAQTTRDAFVLAGGHVDAGAYEYRLNAGDAAGAGENWYLRSTTTAVTPPVPPAPGAPPVPVVVPVPTYRAEASLYAALPSQLRQGNLAMLGDMHKRLGDDDAKGSVPDAGSTPRRAWARVLSTDIDVQQGGTVSPASKGRLTGFQAGTDLLATPHWRAGLYVGQLDGDATTTGFASGVRNLRTGRNDLRSQYAGVYGTYVGASGFYADVVVQSGRHRYTAEPMLGAGIGGKGHSLLGSIEVGQAFALGGSGWRIEPQLQLIHQHIDLGNTAIVGAVVQPRADSGWIARAGVRVKGEIDTGMGTLQPYGRFNVYKSSSGTDIARFVNGATTTDIAAPTGGTSTELAGGFTMALSQTTSLYGEVGKLWSSGGNAKVKSSINGALGVRVKW
ncbi:autotransporter outer membrane beta-barrel domain-containing protein [Variovorax sp. RO1]|nr:autotransporter outer membrane beta-barrel domain-containing protein [Variovorax sp. RO1]